MTERVGQRDDDLERVATSSSDVSDASDPVAVDEDEGMPVDRGRVGVSASDRKPDRPANWNSRLSPKQSILLIALIAYGGMALMVILAAVALYFGTRD